MLLVSMGLWAVVVYCTRAAGAGNPVYEQLRRCEPELLKRCDAVIVGARQAHDMEEVAFVRRFYRLLLLGILAFFLEVALLLGLWWSNILPRLCLFLLAKNALAVAGSFAVSRSVYSGERPLRAMLALPGWVVAVDRLSSFVSAVGILPLFLAVNGFWPW